MWQVFEPELRRRLSQLDATASTAERVHAVLLELLPGNEATLEKTAERLGMSKRTLQRRLEDEGRISAPSSTPAAKIWPATICATPVCPVMKSHSYLVLKTPIHFIAPL
jgi:uncharacterized protein (DUF2384 family)